MTPITNTTPAPRIPLHVEVIYKKSYARQPSQGILKNISLTGAFLQVLNGEIDIQDKIMVEFNVSGRTRTLQASVIWKNDRGAGVKFLPFNNRDIQIIDDLMYYVKTTRDNKKSVLESIFKQVA